MKISKEAFFSVGSDLKIPQISLDAMWSELEKNAQEPSSPFAKYLYYLGALIIISAMTWFMNLGWEIFGGGGIFLIAATYALIFALLGHYLWNKEGLRIPAGLLMTIAVCMTPLAIYGLEHYFQFFDSPENYKEYYLRVDSRWVAMELGTIATSLLALRFYPFPFLTAPLFFSSWFLSMDSAQLLFGNEVTWEQKCWVSLVFGLILLGIGFSLDKKGKGGYAFWAYLFGSLAFWGGLGCLVWDKSEAVLFVYALINLLMMIFSILLRRTVLMVFGALGIFAYLAHLTQTLFADSVYFPFVLTLFGLAIVYLGILYQRNMKFLEKKILEIIPSSIRTLLRTTHEQ